MGNVLHHIVVPPAPETYASNKPVTDGFHTGQRTVTNLLENCAGVPYDAVPAIQIQTMEGVLKLLRALGLSLQSAVALMLGFVAVWLVNVAGGATINAIFPGSVATDGLPLTALTQGLYLPILFLAGISATFTVVLVAPRSPKIHAAVFLLLALVADTFMTMAHWETWPFWFSALVLLTVPLQIWAGAVLGLRVRRR